MIRSKRAVILLVLLVSMVCGVSLYAQYEPEAWGRVSYSEESGFDRAIRGFGNPKRDTYEYEDHIVGYRENGIGMNIYFRGRPYLHKSSKESSSIKIGSETAHLYELTYKRRNIKIYIKDRAFLVFKGKKLKDPDKTIYFKDIDSISIRYE